MSKDLRKKKKITIPTILLMVLMAVIGFTFLYPFYYLFINSIKPDSLEYYKFPFSWPQDEMTVKTYEVMIENFEIFKYFKNTLIVVIFSLGIVMPLAVCTAFTFAKYKFRGSNLIYLLMVAAMTVPAQVTAIPIYIAFGKIGLVNNYSGMIIVNLGMICSCVVMMTSFFRGIPNELLDSAQLDGCGYFRTIWNIVVPIGKPAIIIQFILSFNVIWNNLFMSKILLQKTDVKMIMPAIADLVGKYEGEPTYMFAGMLLAVLPTLLIYLVFQKQIVRGVLAGSVKG